MDDAVSGSSLPRKGLQSALNHLEKGMILVVDRNDRLARDMLVALTIHNEVEKLGCTIEFADGSPLRSTPEGKLFSNILSAFAQFEREKFALRTKAGMARKKAAGVWCGRPPIGWVKIKDKDELQSHPEEQGAIAFAHYLRDLGDNSETIARKLTEHHYPCRGKPWSARTIRRILAQKSSKVV